MRKNDFAAACVTQLAAWGVQTLFGVAGDDILPFLDAIAQDGRIRFIGAAHEAGAAFMAWGHARLTGELGVCVSSAAGAVNLAEGLAAAHLDSAPVLALTGQVATDKIGTPVKQYFDQQSLFHAFAPYSELMTDVPAGLRLLVRAMSQASLTRNVAQLSIPSNLWSQPVPAGGIPPGPPPALVTAARGMGSGACQGDLDRAVGLMKEARRPLIVVGVEGRRLRTEIRGLIDAWGAAVVTAQEAKGVAPDSWPEVVGGIGEAWVPPLLSSADCVLLIGTASFEAAFLPGGPVIQLASEPWRVNDLYLWDSLAGDVGACMSLLARRLAGYHPDPAWLQGIIEVRAERDAILEQDARNQERPIHPARLIAELSRSVSRDSIISLDVGAFMHWFDRGMRADGQVVLLSAHWRSMGVGLPAAIAAKVCHPERQVVALIGDGGFLMSGGELVTVVQYGLPITIVVVNNRGYALERDKAQAKGLEPAGLELANVDFAAWARACGAEGIRVESPDQLTGALGSALSSGRPTVLDVVCANVPLTSIP